ncbi:MAG TPA: GntR family transcriptional regulator [Hydrogenophaga sp.]|uniref:GntR family transcriptional regulator n=1 Tax=Hydrogenophaga sp. TaxID=1904254 RepID=UPI002C274900|nr:GntR family transcriptional regulator [Hydrogenophaga sp.]HMN93117.1 GntR family transcriptional regulator [Hydrogenophaga sp.]HMP10925.1 GntR family transcriptional regulator [Hydrogenophaga sp.]
MAQLLQIANSPDLVDQVYRVLLDAISTGQLAPGQRLTQEELAEQLSVSRQPVMQALRLLKKDGFVADAPAVCGGPGKSRGLQVAPIEAAWIAQVYQVRGALDVLAVRLAAARSTRLDPELIRRGRKAVEAGDVKAMIETDLAFHQAIYRAAGNPLIEQSALLHWHHIRRTMGEALQTSQLRATVWDEHQAMAEAVAAGDVPRAESLMQHHSGQASEHLQVQIREETPTVTALSSAHGQLRGSRQPG